MTNPKKSQTLHVESLGEELSVYDWQRLQMHSLNPTASKVFEMCDGQTSPAQMAKRLKAPEAVVWQSLDELGKASLLSDAPEKPASYQNMTRQQFLKLGGAVALASIVSIVVPRPAAAQSAAAPAAGGGGGGAAPIVCPIVRTATTSALTAGAYTDFSLNAPITPAELAACNPTQITYAWQNGAIPGTQLNIWLRATIGNNASAGVFIPNGTSSPHTEVGTDYFNPPRDYDQIRLQHMGSDWNPGPGTVTVTLS